MTAGSLRTSEGTPSQMTWPSSRQYTRSLMLMINGMSCSMTSIEAESSRLISLIRGPKASVSRWATPAVGSSRQSKRASRARRPASSTMRRVPVDRSAMYMSA